MTPGKQQNLGKQGHIIIVDPYSSGLYLVQELQQQQYPMIGIQSSQKVAQFWLDQFDPSLFRHTLAHKDIPSTLDALADFEIIACIAGSEPGVFLAEELQGALGLVGNDPKTTKWRRHKFHMQERLRELNIRAINQTYASNVFECCIWQSEWGRWPIIVKPAASGGTDGVYWCHNQEDCRLAFEKECNKLNVNGEFNDKLLCQEFLDGLEYIVDAVSYDGRHVVSALWVYEKTRDFTTKSISYQYARIIPSTGEIADQLIDYAWKVLDALGIRYGPSHTEIMMTEDGPCLVETGARMHGFKGPKMTELATGLGTHELVVDVTLNGARIFNELHARNYRYVLKKFAFEGMFMNLTKEGILKQDINLNRIKELDSVLDVFTVVKKGQRLHLTRDLASCPGFILLVHASLEKCMDDLRYLRSIEPDLYDVYSCHGLEEESTAEDGMSCASPFCMSPAHTRRSFVEEDFLDAEFRLEGFDAGS